MLRKQSSEMANLNSFYFIHGLGGHAINTWTHTSRRLESPIMWPRDLLPASLKNQGFFGRFSTIGYKANPLEQATITSSAKRLLDSLIEERSPVRHSTDNSPLEHNIYNFC